MVAINTSIKSLNGKNFLSKPSSCRADFLAETHKNDKKGWMIKRKMLWLRLAYFSYFSSIGDFRFLQADKALHRPGKIVGVLV